MIELNKIYNEDCLEFMRKLPSEYIDLIIADLPSIYSGIKQFIPQYIEKYLNEIRVWSRNL